MKIQMMPRTATIHMAELVKLTSNPPADSGATSWISNCARGLCATASTLVFILPAVLADTGYLPNIPECRAHAHKEQDEQAPRARAEHAVQKPTDQQDAQNGGQQDRKRVVSGKSVSVRVDLGGRRISQKKRYRSRRSRETAQKE